MGLGELLSTENMKIMMRRISFSEKLRKARLWERENIQYGGKEIKTTVYCSFYWFI